jgi:hypothetical protein
MFIYLATGYLNFPGVLVKGERIYEELNLGL